MVVTTLGLQIQYTEGLLRLYHCKSILLTSNHCSRPLRHYPDDITLCSIQSKRRTHCLSPCLSVFSGFYPFAVHLFSLCMKSLPSIQNFGNKTKKGWPLFMDGKMEVVGRAWNSSRFSGKNDFPIQPKYRAGTFLISNQI